jgi:hypothetical protein
MGSFLQNQFLVEVISIQRSREAGIEPRFYHDWEILARQCSLLVHDPLRVGLGYLSLTLGVGLRHAPRGGE